LEGRGVEGTEERKEERYEGERRGVEGEGGKVKVGEGRGCSVFILRVQKKLGLQASTSSQLLVPVSGTPCRKIRHQHHH